MASTTWTIQNTASGATVWQGEAATEAEALDAMARDAGYADYAAACAAAPVAEGEIVVTQD